MQRIISYGNAFRNFAIMFSFIMNFVLLIILLIVVQQIFIIKNGIAEPLIDGLHSNFVGLDEATIKTEIPVNDEIGINFTLPINQATTVVLTGAVPLSANTTIVLNDTPLPAIVSLNLPVGLELPVQLSMDVPVQATIPINIMVPVEIPLRDTQLHQPFVNLRDLFEPFVRSLDNLPSEWNEVPDFSMDAIQGDVNLLKETEGSRDPWDEEKEWGIAAPPGTTVPDGGTGTDGIPPTVDPNVPPPTVDPNAPVLPTATTVPLLPSNEATTEPDASAEPQG